MPAPVNVYRNIKIGLLASEKELVSRGYVEEKTFKDFCSIRVNATPMTYGAEEAKKYAAAQRQAGHMARIVKRYGDEWRVYVKRASSTEA